MKKKTIVFVTIAVLGAAGRKKQNRINLSNT